ncbi:MAG: segregation/condensation protein A [Pseudomonadales bacterium]|nr:segregation/condensation protein A [Pseudomonadales bacterium]MBO6566490.1 segregation/condensation protein A [Pseudomonadales bacterium]MBO6596040.1 segregation/condensation protein A [Pseudomonadales bacterium]MBO6656421.1 segregation/condensation protein A [Pseudomonadales bacterium]MBO6702660.1 segregation/condensation protein A [Pseudomonadales bacterium]
MDETTAEAENDTERPQKTTGVVQGEMPFAVVQGSPVTQLPLDLYIPPDALEVILEAFEGPLDLLLYLIRKQNLDILDIQVYEITKQYMEYIELMEEMQFEIAAEYLVMAAVLAEIKSRMLLPRQAEEDEDEDDPRAELIRKLQEYERFKQAAMDIDELQRLNRNFWVAMAEAPVTETVRPLPEVQLQDLLVELSRVLKRAENFSHHHIALEPLSTRERMSNILDRVSDTGDQFVPFISLFQVEEGRSGVIVTFIAVMELIKESLLELVQSEPFAPIHVKSRTSSFEEVEEAPFSEEGASDDDNEPNL